MMGLRSLFYAWFLLGVILLGCAPPKTTMLFPEPQAVPIRDRYAFLLIIDGARPDVIEALINTGKLPTMKRLFFEQGAVFTHATTVFPTLSIPGHQAIMTGLFPGNHGTPDLTWFDRSTLETIDYLGIAGHRRTNSDLINRYLLYRDDGNSDHAHTLFGALRGHPTVSSYEIIFHGATHVYPKVIAGAAWHSIVEKRSEHLDMAALGTALDHWKSDAEFPRLTVISCYGLDELSHKISSTGDRVELLYQAIDAALAEFETVAQKKGVLDRMTWIVTADHGQHLTEQKTLDLVGLLSKAGFRVEDDFLVKGRDLQISARSVSNAQIYLRLHGDWKERPTLDEILAVSLPQNPHRSLVSQLLDTDGVGLLLMRNGDHDLRLMNRDSAADIVSFRYGNDDWHAYRPLSEGSDPLGYLADPEMRGKWRPGEFYASSEWQRMSKDSRHPDAIPALAQLANGPEAGDIVLITDPATSIRSAKASNHGSIEREDMRVPLLVNGPDTMRGRYDIARVVDIYPTLLAIFGIDEDAFFYDGRALEIVSPVPTQNRGNLSQQMAKIELAFLDPSPRVRPRALPRHLLAALDSEFRQEETQLSEALAHMTTLEHRLDAYTPRTALEKTQKARLLDRLRWEKDRFYKRLARFEQIRQVLSESGSSQ